MKGLIILLFLLSAVLSAAAQENNGYAKLGASLKLFLHDPPSSSVFLVNEKGQLQLSVLLELEPGISDAELLKKGIRIRTRMGSVATADIPFQALQSLSASPAIKRIELPLLLQRTDTLMRKFTGVDQVLAGKQPLEKSFTGRNTIIGIIDDGIDITHPDFYDSSGKLRIITAWNMDGRGQPPAGYFYGTEWSRDSMEFYARDYSNGRISNLKMENLFGFAFHGTPVAGLAAGKRGVATDAELISVALTATADTFLRSDRMLDGIKYIYEEAKRKGKKCIINISLGVLNGGPHDGKTLLEKAIDQYTSEKTDLLICTSVGNSGNDWKHWGGFPIHRDSSYSFFRCGYEGTLYFSVPRQYSSTLSLSFTDSKPVNIYQQNLFPDTINGQTPFYRITDLINGSQPVTVETRFKNGSLSSKFQLSASHYNDDYDEVLVKVNEYSSSNSKLDEHLYRFIWKGQGIVHAWFPYLNLHPRFTFQNNPFPADSTFRMTDNEYSSVIPTNAFSVLSTGAFNIRSCYLNMRNEVVNQYQRCRTTYFTSHGPTLDGRIKPDIISPGENVMSSRKRYDNFYGHQMIIDSNTIAFGGTSASSPITEGIAALLWEKSPELMPTDIIQRLKNTASFDSWSANFGNRPNNVAGWGKINAFKALTGTDLDIGAACNEKDSCQQTPPPGPVDPPVTTAETFSVYPNPASAQLFVRYSSPHPIQLRLLDATSRLLMTRSLPASGTRTTGLLDISGMAQGTYFLQLYTPANNKTFKIIIAR